MTTTHSDALAALSTVDATRAELARVVSCPPWRHALFGAIAGTYVAAPAAGLPGMLIVCGVVALLIGVVVWTDRQRMGTFVNGYRSGKTRPRTLAFVAALLALYMLGLWFSEERGLHWVPLALGVATIPLAIIASLGWQRTFRREMGLAA